MPLATPTVQSNCQILALPEKIRTIIYSFCIEQAPVQMRLKKDMVGLNRHDSRQKPATNIDTRSSTSPVPGSRNFHALTQVSRLLRSEFRPMYLAASTVSVRAEDVTRYLGDFHLPSSPPDPATKPAEQGHHITILCTNYDTSFIIRYLKLAFRYPYITFRAHNVETNRPMRAANSLLEQCSNASFRAFLQDSIDVVYIKEKKSQTSIEFYMKDEHVEEAQFLDAYPTAEKWLEEMDLREALEGYEVVLFVAESVIT